MSKVKVISSGEIPQKIKKIIGIFSEITKKKCTGVTSAPGRINLIGEHIDYMGYPVVPSAIKQSTLVAFCKEDRQNLKINLHNTEENYTPLTIEFNNLNEILNLDLTKTHHWTNYALCGFVGLFKEGKISKFPTSEVTLLVKGDVPVGKGLSSSSSINCSCTLAYLCIFHLASELTKKEISNLCINSERLVGMAGGGMDQTISIFGEKGIAKFVEFEPNLRVSSVKIASGYQFVVADSLVESNKNQTASKCYNVRVMECRLGAAIFGKKFNVDSWNKTKNLYNLQKDLNKSLPEMIELTKKTLPEKISLEKVGELLEMDEKTLLQSYFLNHGNLIQLEKKNEKELKLRDRCLHVFSEAQRVYEFRKNSENANILGNLMNQSHFSCRDLYEASCPELEKLTGICRKFGALGSRFTGAGWGGCTISLVKDSNVEKFLENVWIGFYEGKVKKEEKNSVLFNTMAEDGALIFKLQ